LERVVDAGPGGALNVTVIVVFPVDAAVTTLNAGGGGAIVPFPVKVSVFAGFKGSLLVTVKVPLSAPAALGLNVMTTVQDCKVPRLCGIGQPLVV
jgi:hypothetical protein